MAAISLACRAASGTRKRCWNSNAAAKRWPAVSKKPTRCCAKPDTRQRPKRRAPIVFLDCRIHYGTFAAYDSFTLRCAIPKRATRTIMHLDFSFSEAEGSAPLHHRVITNGLDDRWP